MRTAILFCSLFYIALTSDILAHPAWGIVVDRSRQIYFSDLETVYKIDSQGKLSIFRAGISGRHVHDLSIDADGNLYGWENVYEPQGEKFLRAFWKMSPAGEFTEIVPLTENPPSGISIWRDAGGNTYSVEPWSNEKKIAKIIKRAADGVTGVFAGGKYGYLDGQKKQAEFGAIVDMAFGIDDAIYLTDSNRVRKIDKTGVVKTIYSDELTAKNQKTPQAPSQLFGLDIDKEHNVFAADFANSRLLKINSGGAVSTFLTSEKDWSPLGVATFGDEVYVLEGRPLSASTHAGNRVLKISANGNSTVVANLEDRNIRADNTNSINDNLFSQNQDNAASSVNPTSLKTTAVPLGFYGVVGALSIAFFALIIFGRKK
jgi:hypothetical protein